MKVIYLAAGSGEIDYKNTTYQDMYIKRDIGGDMLKININSYDIIIATPPCNYWSRARGNRKPSQYALDTKHLLPGIIEKLENQNKPYIIENVINKKLMKDIINNFSGHYYEIGRHSYFTNIMINFSKINQINENIKLINSKNRQGSINVKNVLDYFIKYVMENEKWKQ